MATILIVEDNPANTRFATFLLESLGHTVVPAMDAETGVPLARQVLPALILMDIQLPGIDGLAATAMLKGDPATRSTPIVALTALTMPGDEERIRAAGCDGYIAKPIRYQSFLASVGAHLASPPAPREENEGSARILVVDDDRHARDALEVMLQAEGFVVDSAESGEQALEVVLQLRPELILVDILMPGMGGYQLVGKLKSDPATKTIPVIMVTSLDGRDARQLAMTAGAEDFIVKPVNRDELSMRVRNHLRIRTYADYRDKHSELLEGEIGLRTADFIESESLYRATFDAAPVGILHAAPGGRFLRVNARLCELLRYSQEELQRINVQDLMDPEAAAAQVEPFGRLAAGTLERHVIEEARYRRGDGTFLWARSKVAAYRNVQGELQYFIGILEDITERRILEAQLRQASRLDAVGQLAAGVAHDFNNLLSVVISYTDLIADDLKEGDPTKLDLLEIKGAGLRAVALTRQLLAFSRQQVLKPQVVDLGQIVRDMERMLQRILGEGMLLGSIHAPALSKILVDPGQMEQVIVNLVVNARDAMPRGGKLTIETAEIVLDDAYAAEHVGVTPGLHVMLAVSDTGTGIDKATQARMFEPFFTTKEVGKGTGLGLATIFGIVKQSGGTIGVYSELGLGTTFKVYFPVTLQARVDAAQPSATEPVTLRGSETILLVEDEEQVRVLIHAILRKYGYEVIVASSPGDALLLSEQHKLPIHLLLTDVVMPHMGGRQLAERITAQRPAVKVLCMSGYTGETALRNGLLDETIAFIQKPITPDALARKLREVLG